MKALALAARLWLGAAAPAAVPGDAACHALPPLPGSRLPFIAGEKLEYAVDLLGGLKVGNVVMTVDPPTKQDAGVVIPIEAHAVANGLVASIGHIESRATTWLRIHDLHPVHYREDYEQPDGKFWTEVLFPTAKPHQIRFRFGQPNGTGERAFPYGNDALDVVGVFYWLRAFGPKLGDSLCFDVYGSRHVWRVWGDVATREPTTTPAGVFRTLRMTGHAARLDKRDQVRDLFFWITDDPRHLPVAAMGDLEIGPLRALLTGLGQDHKRPDTDR